jgi:hypothetical protein
MNIMRVEEFGAIGMTPRQVRSIESELEETPA